MDSLLLEPICNSQEHIFARKEGDDNCELCSKRLTDYKCKNCYRELCNNCHTDMILSIRDEQLRRTRDILLEKSDKIRRSDIQVDNYVREKIIVKDITERRRDSYNKSKIIHRNDRQLVGRKIENNQSSITRGWKCFRDLFN